MTERRRSQRVRLEVLARPTHRGYFVCTPESELAGVVNLNEIVQGGFKSAYLGYYSLVPHHGRGLMQAGLGAVIARAFRSFGCTGSRPTCSRATGLRSA
jgi:RimJ/RimL family protein N-acetyltransferase